MINLKSIDAEPGALCDHSMHSDHAPSWARAVAPGIPKVSILMSAPVELGQIGIDHIDDGYLASGERYMRNAVNKRDPLKPLVHLALAVLSSG